MNMNLHRLQSPNSSARSLASASAPRSRRRKITGNDPDAATFRVIFRRYADLCVVALLRVDFDRLGIVSKRREGAGGRLAGGKRSS
jgi:hypothetical protein